MTGDLYWLALTVALSLVIWIPYAGLYGNLVGMKTAMTDTPPHDQLPEWARRCHRAHMNLIETLVPFATLVLILFVTDKTTGATATATAIFFFARLGHAVIYTLAVPFLRTPVYAVSLACCFFLLKQVLT